MKCFEISTGKCSDKLAFTNKMMKPVFMNYAMKTPFVIKLFCAPYVSSPPMYLTMYMMENFRMTLMPMTMKAIEWPRDLDIRISK